MEARTRVHLGLRKLSEVKMLLIGERIREFFGSTNFDVRFDKHRKVYKGRQTSRIIIGVSTIENGISNSFKGNFDILEFKLFVELLLLDIYDDR